MHRAVVLGTGSCLPRRVLTNDDLEQMVDTSDEWITARTGIRTRRIAGDGEQNYQLASGAAEKALESAGVSAEEIDLVIVATLTPHMMMPSCACFVQAEIGAENEAPVSIAATGARAASGLATTPKKTRTRTYIDDETRFRNPIHKRCPLTNSGTEMGVARTVG